MVGSLLVHGHGPRELTQLFQERCNKTDSCFELFRPQIYILLHHALTSGDIYLVFRCSGSLDYMINQFVVQLV